MIDDAADHGQPRRRQRPPLPRGQLRPNCHERPLDPVVNGAQLRDQRGLVVAPQVAALPAVEPARLAVGHRGVDERRDEPAHGQLGITG